MAIDIVNPYDMAITQFDEAADRLGLSQAMRAILRKPKRELIVNFRNYSGLLQTCESRRNQLK